MRTLQAVDGVQSKMVIQDGKTVLGTVQDCTPFIEDVKARHNEGLHGSSEMKHAARIPNVVVEMYCNQQGIEFHEFMANPVHIKRLVNDPALAAFRIWPGRV